jgi:hypothetical protein
MRNAEHNEIVSINNISKVRAFLGSCAFEAQYFTDNELIHIQSICSGMVERAVIRCLVGIAQKAKAQKCPPDMFAARIMRDRLESGIVTVDEVINNNMHV